MRVYVTRNRQYIIYCYLIIIFQIQNYEFWLQGRYTCTPNIAIYMIKENVLYTFLLVQKKKKHNDG